MHPAREARLFAEFLSKAVADYSFTGGDLFIVEATLRREIPRFERLLGAAAARDQAFHSLTRRQCERCLDEMLRDEALIPRLMLVEAFAISQWSIKGRSSPTDSRVHLYYGLKPRLSTFLQFDTIEQFNFVKHVLENLRLCRLNARHLREVKRV
jgi:hypothetical protein